MSVALPFDRTYARRILAEIQADPATYEDLSKLYTIAAVVHLQIVRRMIEADAEVVQELGDDEYATRAALILRAKVEEAAGWVQEIENEDRGRGDPV